MHDFVFDNVNDYILLIVVFGALLVGALILLGAQLKKNANWHLLWQTAIVIFLMVTLAPEGWRLLHKAHTIHFGFDEIVLDFIGPLPSRAFDYHKLNTFGIVRHYTFDEDRVITGSNWSIRIAAETAPIISVETDDLNAVKRIRQLIHDRSSVNIRYFYAFGRVSTPARTTEREVLSENPIIDELPVDFEMPFRFRVMKFLEYLP